jgi:hypothetical protein
MRHAARGVKLDEPISCKLRAFVEASGFQPRDFALNLPSERCHHGLRTNREDRVLASIDFFARANDRMTGASGMI